MNIICLFATINIIVLNMITFHYNDFYYFISTDLFIIIIIILFYLE